ncbi:tautomerase family protein [Marinobacter sp. SS21]|uniref:tautomerase family protein n=1 Tax=Marinobacter sp. SS21 TaxID=2979460 RepID=UPI00232C5C71|nr:4-oxalocrotonate tautomerase family protein [Marinobacter sp. SS21]MDC0663398.1 4-oxalocrotonate tautomerase family protein [Marinobacter sp. SS21]
MPYVNIQITDTGVTREDKARLIEGTTRLLWEVLGKDPASTFVVINEIGLDNWGVAGEQVSQRSKR